MSDSDSRRSIIVPMCDIELIIFQLGWSLNLCTDEDECRNAPCNDEQDCINTAGSYKCVQKGISQNLKLT